MHGAVDFDARVCVTSGRPCYMARSSTTLHGGALPSPPRLPPSQAARDKGKDKGKTKEFVQQQRKAPP